MVIGAQKCGTGSLHYYLGLHPEIAMSRRKELNFFVEDEVGNMMGAAAGALQLIGYAIIKKIVTIEV